MIANHNGNVKSEKVLRDVEFLKKRYEDEFERIAGQLSIGIDTRVLYFGSRDMRKQLMKMQRVSVINCSDDLIISSFMTDALNIPRNEFIGLEKERDTIKLLDDANKVCMDSIIYESADWIVLDCLSEVSEKYVVTWNDKVTHIKKPDSKQLCDILEAYFLKKKLIYEVVSENDDVTKLYRDFAKLISEKQYCEKIIVNEVYFAESYLNEKLEICLDEDAIRKNTILKQCYENLYQYIPNCKRIKPILGVCKYCKENLTYTQDEMEYRLKALECIFDGNDKEVEDLYLRYSAMNRMKRIKRQN